MFKLNEIITEKQSDKFNKYKDTIEDISEMSHNAECSSDQNNNSLSSKKTHMRLEIARLQHDIEQMKISRSDSADDEIRADLTEYLQQKEKISVIIKVLEEFRS
ncbi:uncharacterized protein BDCG_16473 [Blastomyces dermatitidis ER-3]|uniref:Uncharacterized protein n=1 Tax=Ajellomyces dermatitidis (strain ER-3 / ATCC MYA-2586) TaxID=559297 RepID=A0ABX2VSB0_AJEDR|nr:uncharacterized protein BDCG_16473 [Blastomyces dermatitidis ER-3]OAT00104.1 hypothetical protein BDCG_16473 [Blastomyces dermatitidis ER-3]